MKYSLCLTNYNRYEMLIDSFYDVMDDERIDEIVISDDASDKQIEGWLTAYAKAFPKIKLFTHYENVGMLENKKQAISYAKNDWVIIFDSDNVLKPDYLDSLESNIDEFGELDIKTVYMPDFAKPKFDFRNFSGCTFDLTNISQLISDPMGNVAFNCCNYLVNKKYFKVSKNPNIKGSDTQWINFMLLKEGFSFYIVPNMSYEHTVHEGSGFMADVSYNMTMAESVRQLILRESSQINSK